MPLRASARRLLIGTANGEPLKRLWGTPRGTGATLGDIPPVPARWPMDEREAQRAGYPLTIPASPGKRSHAAGVRHTQLRGNLPTGEQAYGFQLRHHGSRYRQDDEFPHQRRHQGSSKHPRTGSHRTDCRCFRNPRSDARLTSPSLGKHSRPRHDAARGGGICGSTLFRLRECRRAGRRSDGSYAVGAGETRCSGPQRDGRRQPWRFHGWPGRAHRPLRFDDFHHSPGGCVRRTSPGEIACERIPRQLPGRANMRRPQPGHRLAVLLTWYRGVRYGYACGGTCLVC